MEPTLVFDGDCGFCTAAAGWVAGRWTRPARTVAFQHLGPAELAAMGLDWRAASAAWWIDPEGVAHRGHLALAGALAWAGGAWGLVGRALGSPPLSWLGRLGYPVVVRYRHHLPGATPACQVPGAGQR